MFSPTSHMADGCERRLGSLPGSTRVRGWRGGGGGKGDEWREGVSYCFFFFFTDARQHVSN